TWSLHHDPETWGTDAEIFRPERFGEEKATERNRSWTPFGVGPRQCIGMRFALLEAKTVVCHMLRRFRIHRLPGHELCLRLREMGTVWPDSARAVFEAI
ncbi:hypothetical protein AB6A40_006825, partial [Gnathostoma spinigerum]